MKLQIGLQKPFIDGIISGILLTILFKFVEYFTPNKVYTLLLNVDYIPFLNQQKLMETIEVALHLTISIILSMCLYLLVHYLKIVSPRKIIIFYVFVCFLIGLLLFSTTALSVRTPSITSLPAITYWLVGHIFYGYTLGFLFIKRLN